MAAPFPGLEAACMAVLSPVHVPTNYASLSPSCGLQSAARSLCCCLLQLLLAHRSMSLGSCFLCTSLIFPLQDSALLTRLERNKVRGIGAGKRQQADFYFVLFFLLLAG